MKKRKPISKEEKNRIQSETNQQSTWKKRKTQNKTRKNRKKNNQKQTRKNSKTNENKQKKLKDRLTPHVELYVLGKQECETKGRRRFVSCRL